jgi:AraC-like DNA-binding protein
MNQLRFCELPSRSTMQRHSHMEPYAALVVSGCYEEAGDRGRHRVAAGDVLIHGPFSTHCDRVPGGCNRVLDIPLPPHGLLKGSIGRVRDVDAIVNVALKDPHAALDALLEQLIIVKPTTIDLPDALATALASSVPPQIATWASEHGLARETLSRQFHALYEVSPARYRVEARVRRALAMLSSQPLLSLVSVAADCGFADQAHLSRDVTKLTGASPRYWQARARRASHLFKTVSKDGS